MQEQQQSTGRAPARNRYDEARAAGGELRPHWRALLSLLGDASIAQRREWQDTAHRRILENGITYNIYADPKGADRPWALDIVPLVLPAAEWQQIAAGISQRARLLDRVLADLYGPQQLLEERAVPPALVYGHHGYLWSCRGITPPGGRHLHVYAADIARAADGRWWVLADRTQAPSGAGYALENRMIVSRLLPEPYRDLHVSHLADYYRLLQETLAAHAPVDAGEMPCIVLLTPGPLNETYFEHVYLARHLGFALVEGQDLTVRGDTLYMKTLGGLRRVHAILRRLDDDFCDPLDLRAESTLGVPGLVEVARAGRVLIANALGSGVLESSAITGFLPPLCARLLNEPLVMPSVATWWCGEAAALAYVEQHLEELVLKPAYPSQRMEPVFGNRLDATARAQWLARVRARPNAYVAQELLHLSQAPVLASDLTTGDAPQLQPRSIGLRVYAVATADGSWQVMPGGLARVAGDTSIDVVSMQRGGSSKDTWVLAEASATTNTAARGAIGVRELVRGPTALPSRSAENLFWLGRYTERVACHARLLRQAMAQLLDADDAADSALPALLALCESWFLLPAPVTPAQRVEQRLLAAVFDEALPGSLVCTVQRAARTAQHVREHLSVEHWQAMERLQDAARSLRAPRQRARLGLALTLLDRVLLAGASLVGHAIDDMVRDTGWYFLVAGRRIERLQFLAGTVARLLAPADAAAPLPPATAPLLLGVADCVDAWRQRYPRAPELLPALDIVVFDAAHPHALAFQAGKLLRTLDKLRALLGDVPDSGLAPAVEQLRTFDLSTLDAPGGIADLAARLAAVQRATAGLSDQLAHRFFTHVADAPPQLLAV